MATSAFGMGVDYPHVRAVIHIGAPRDIISFAQEIGRLGRNRRGGTSRVMLPYNWQANALLSRPKAEFQTLPKLAMQTYLGPCRCLAAVLSRFQDRGEHIQYCSHEQRHQWCTRCQQFGRLETGQETDPTEYWDGEKGTEDGRREGREGGEVGDGEGETDGDSVGYNGS